MATQPQTIDCQVHCYAANTPNAPGATTWKAPTKSPATAWWPP